jgi:hypothetical protein
MDQVHATIPLEILKLVKALCEVGHTCSAPGQMHRFRLLIEIGQSCSISQYDLSLGLPDEAENVTVPELRQGTRDRLQRQPQIVGDIATVHGKAHDSGRSQADVHFDQESGDFLDCRFPPEQQHVSFGMLKAARDEPEHIVRRGRAAAFLLDDVLAIGQTDIRFDNRLGGKSMNYTVLDAEDVTGQMKGHDLPATVSQQFIASNRPALDLVKILDRLRLSEDLGATPIFEFTAKHSVPGERVQFARAWSLGRNLLLPYEHSFIPPRCAEPN